MSKPKNKGGRPKKEIDWKQVDSLLYIQCTAAEIASVTDISHSTLDRGCKAQHNMGFDEYSALKREGGKASLRRSMWLVATDTKKINVAAMIFACKGYLGMRDHDRSSVDVKTTVETLSTETKEKIVTEIKQRFAAECGDDEE